MPDWRSEVDRLVARSDLDGAFKAELVEELTSHLENRFADLRAAGLSEDEAFRQVLSELDDPDGFTKALRTIRRAAPRVSAQIGSTSGTGRKNMFRGLGHDFKVAIRTVRSKPGFSLMVIALLALGVAGNTAMFSVFNGLFLRPWPIADIDRMVDIDETAPKWNLRFVHVAVPDYLAWQKDNTTFESMAFWDDGGFNLSSADGSSSRIDGVRVTHTLLDVLKLKPVIGRNITPEEDTFNGPKVVLLGHSLWERQF